MLGAVPERSARLGRDTEGSPVSGVKDAPASTARPAGSVAGEQRRGRSAQTVGDSREGERSAASAEWGGRTGRETESRLGNSVQSAASQEACADHHEALHAGQTGRRPQGGRCEVSQKLVLTV